jgi:hypothetical protein
MDDAIIAARIDACRHGRGAEKAVGDLQTVVQNRTIKQLDTLVGSSESISRGYWTDAKSWGGTMIRSTCTEYA